MRRKSASLLKRVNRLRVAEHSGGSRGFRSPRLAPERVTYVRNPKTIVTDRADHTPGAKPHEPRRAEIIRGRPEAAEFLSMGWVGYERIRIWVFGLLIPRGRPARRCFLLFS